MWLDRRVVVNDYIRKTGCKDMKSVLIQTNVRCIELFRVLMCSGVMISLNYQLLYFNFTTANCRCHPPS